MSKELNFQFGDDVLKYQDSNSALNLYLSENGLPFDLTRFDFLSLKIGNDDGYLLEKSVDLSNIPNPQSGNITIPLNGDIMTKLVPGEYSLELWGNINPIIYNPEPNDINITVSDLGLIDSQAIFPSDGNLIFTVDDNINSSPFDTINAYPIDDIWQEISDKLDSAQSILEKNLSDYVAEGKFNGTLDSALVYRGQWTSDLITLAKQTVSGYYSLVNNNLGINLDENWDGNGVIEIIRFQGNSGNAFATIKSSKKTWFLEVKSDGTWTEDSSQTNTITTKYVDSAINEYLNSYATQATLSNASMANSLQSYVQSIANSYASSLASSASTSSIPSKQQSNTQSTDPIGFDISGFVQNSDGTRKYITSNGEFLTGNQLVGGENISFDLNGNQIDDSGNPINWSNNLSPQSKDFDIKWGYSGNDLGASYTPETTVIKVWSPTAKQIVVNVFKNADDQNPTTSINMARGDKFSPDNHKRNTCAVWTAKYRGDMKNLYYQFSIVQSDGSTSVTQDPYSIATSADGNKSVVVDLTMTDPNGFSTNYSGRVSNPVDAKIGELNIHDFTISETSGVSDNLKGKLLGLIETGTTNPMSGLSTCFDYLCNSSLNYIQLMPMMDTSYKDSIQSTIGWGYDPKNYNVVENQFSTDPNSPTKAISEFKQVIQKFHDNGIGVVMDVVYNHIAWLDGSSFNKLVPNYYFRYNSDGSLSNGSFCGNDIRTECEMMSKFIVESLKYWHDEFGVDGFRFDLLGCLNIETVENIQNEFSGKNILLYGEGWDSPTNLSENEKTTQPNAYNVPGVGFFSDAFRKSIAGDGENQYDKGLVAENSPNMEEVADVILGSENKVNSVGYTSPNQAINYVEVHDGKTLTDKFWYLYPNDSTDVHNQRMKLANAIVALSQGVPFIQVGQTFWRNKEGNDNSYNAPDSINALNWDYLKYHQDTDQDFTNLLNLRTNNQLFRASSYADVNNTMTIDNKVDNSNIVSYTLKNNSDKYIVIFNASPNPVAFGKNINYSDQRLTNMYTDVDFSYNNQLISDYASVTNGQITVNPHSYAIAHFNS